MACAFCVLHEETSKDKCVTGTLKGVELEAQNRTLQNSDINIMLE